MSARTVRGFVVFILLLINTPIYGMTVYIDVITINEKQEKFRINGTGFVVGNIKDKSIVVTAGHAFPMNEKIHELSVYGLKGKLLYSKYTPNSTNALDEDIAIIEVEADWKPKWKLSEPIPNEYIKLQGFSEGVKITLNGVMDEKCYLINEIYIIQGQSGGPIFVKRNKEEFVIGSVVGSVQAKIVNSDNSIKYIHTDYGVFNSGTVIRKRLNEYAPGWENE